MARVPPAFWKEHLHLNYHIEGGWYNEVYRSLLSLHKTSLPDVFPGNRDACTHIYFLLEKDGFSAFHRIRSDELWHFYSGDPLIVYEINEQGLLHEHILGQDPGAGQSPFCVIKAGNWFASRVIPGGEYGLAGCTVSPGFDYADFELANKEELTKKFPAHSDLIHALCR